MNWLSTQREYERHIAKSVKRKISQKNSSLSSGFAVVFPGYDIKCGIMQISSFYRAKKHPPHSKRGGYFFIFGQNFNLMTLAGKPSSFIGYVGYDP